MATFIDEQYYRSQIRTIKKQLEKWDETASKYEGLRYVPTQLNGMKDYPKTIEGLLNQALKFRGKELEAENELESPSELMYSTLSAIYGGMLYYNIPESTVQQVFPNGRPERKSTPAPELHLVLTRLKETFDEELRTHEIALEKKIEVQNLLTKWDELAKGEKEAEKKALGARAALAKANQEFANEESILRHLARADAVLVDGIHSALFSSTKSSSQEENENESSSSDNNKQNEEEAKEAS